MWNELRGDLSIRGERQTRAGTLALANRGIGSMSIASQTLVTMGDLEVVTGFGDLVCTGLGSCIGICALDPVAHVGAMARVMLPGEEGSHDLTRPAKYATQGVRALLDAMEARGGTRANMGVALAGGAQVFGFNATPGLDIGSRNAEAVMAQLALLRWKPAGADLGGNMGRTLVLSLESGQVRIRTAVHGDRLLCTLRGN